MNEKFFDLKKEKQDRMINAALKIFAVNGYKHSSTDDIVKEAGISKGLLFHYFTSKMGLYTFLYDYSVRYLTLELKTSISEGEKDFFAIMKASEQAKASVMRSYPFMQLFIDRSQSEDDDEAIDETIDLRSQLQSLYDGFLNQVDQTLFRNDIDASSVYSMLQYTLRGIMNDQLHSTSFNPELYFTEANRIIDMLKIMSY